MKKKIIALSLVLILLISFSSFVTVSAKTQHDEQLYIDLGILPEKQTYGLIKPSLTREQFAGILVRMQSIDGLAAPETDKAKDVGKSIYRAEIDYCLTGGYFLLDGKGNFNPTAPISYNDAIRALVTALGYDVVVTDKTSDSEYVAVANKIGILKGVRVADSEKLTYNELYQMVTLSMKVGLPVHELISDYSVETLYDRLKVTEYQGTLLANSRRSIGTERTAANIVNIDETEYKVAVDVPDELVGVEVVYYLQDEVIVSISSKASVTTLELTPAEIEDVSDNGSYITIKTNIDPETIKVQKSAIAIVNNETKAPSKALFDNLKDGHVTFVDEGNNGTYDVIHMEIAKTIAVDAISTSSVSMRAKYTDELIKLKEAEDCIEVYKNGKAIAFSDIQKDSIASIVCDSFSFDENGDIVYDYNKITWAKIYVSDIKISGNVDSKKDDYIYIDDMDYLTTYSFNKLVSNGDKDDAELGDYVEAYIDSWGYIADIVVDKTYGGYDYGYLIYAAAENTGMRESLKVKIMNSEGVITIYETSNKFIVDGVPFKEKSTVFDVGGESDVDLQKRQPVSFRVAKDGKLKAIDTVILSPKESNSTLTVSREFNPYELGNDKVRLRNSVVNKQYAIGSDCIVFVDNAGLGLDNPSDYNFSVRAANRFAGSSYQYIGLYDADDMGSAKCAVVYNAYDPDELISGESEVRESLSYQTKSYMVANIAVSRDSKGNRSYKISLANQAGVKTYNTDSTESLAAYSIRDVNDWILTVNSGNRPNTEVLDLYKIDVENLASLLKKGDIVRFTTGDSGNINYIERILKFSEVKDTYVPMTGTSGTHMMFAKLLKTSKDLFKYENPSGGAEEIFSTIGYESVVVYDMENETVSVVKGLSTLPNSSTGDTVKVWMRDYDGGGVQEFFVYKY
ncbi:MAG: hypothetical protein IKA17_01415 [Clostridia bacterium]|nr:hypothetical protein [Clostridia bacterium]